MTLKKNNLREQAQKCEREEGSSQRHSECVMKETTTQKIGTEDKEEHNFRLRS